MPKKWYTLTVVYKGYDPEKDKTIEKAAKSRCDGSGYGGERDMSWHRNHLSAVEKIRDRLREAKIRGVKIFPIQEYPHE